MSWYPAVHRAFRVKIARYVIVSNVSHLREKGRGEGTEPRKHRTLLVSREKKEKNHFLFVEPTLDHESTVSVVETYVHL